MEDLRDGLQASAWVAGIVSPERAGAMAKATKALLAGRREVMC